MAKAVKTARICIVGDRDSIEQKEIEKSRARPSPGVNQHSCTVVIGASSVYTS